ncbi:hypothetical protein [Legionella sp. WA2024007413]
MTTTLLTDSINPFDNLPNEILQYILSLSNHHGMLVCKRFLEADREATKHEAQEFFNHYLITKNLNLESVNPLKIMYFIHVFALNSLPEIEDRLNKIASIGILLLQLYEVLNFYTQHNQIDFTLSREPDVLASSALAVSLLMTSNDESDALRTSITEKDIEKIKDTVSDMLIFLNGTNNEKVKTCSFNEIVMAMMEALKAGMKHASNNSSIFSLRFFGFRPPESKAEMILRLVDQCVAILEQQMLQSQPSCILF